MLRRLAVVLFVLMLVPAAALFRNAPAGAAATSDAASKATPMATSDGRTVGQVSVPFLAAGVLVMMGYRRWVSLYQNWWCRRGEDCSVSGV